MLIILQKENKADKHSSVVTVQLVVFFFFNSLGKCCHQPSSDVVILLREKVQPCRTTALRKEQGRMNQPTYEDNNSERKSGCRRGLNVASRTWMRWEVPALELAGGRWGEPSTRPPDSCCAERKPKPPRRADEVDSAALSYPCGNDSPGKGRQMPIELSENNPDQVWGGAG